MQRLLKLQSYIKPYWIKVVLSLVLLTAVVLMDLAIPRLVQQIIDAGINQQNMAVVYSTTLVMLAISVCSTLFSIGNNFLSVQVGEGIARDVREALYIKIQSFSFAELDRLNTGRLMVRLTSDTNAFQRVVQVFLRIGTRAPLLMVGSIILMVRTAPELALIILPLLALTTFVLYIFISRMSPLFRTVQQKLDRLNMVLQENIAGARLVKAFVRENYESQRFGEANEIYTNHNIKVMQFMATLSPILTALLNAGIVLVVWVGGIRAIQGSLTIGQIVAFVNYLQTTMGPLLIMVMLANVTAAGIASAERLNEVMETIPAITNPSQPLALPPATRPSVSFENVSFRYTGSEDDLILQDINLVAESGQTVAILGATGAGKTTLVNLIPRFYDVVSGRVCVNDLDVRDLDQAELLSMVAVVPQETVLFSGTVKENIRYGRPQASDEEVIAAAQAAQAHAFILKLPKGYDTHVEQRGANFSGGQKQRIAIARALLSHPAILILDDSTSSVDIETETRIQAALSEWMHQRTCFIVAQRISTVLNADKIVLLDEGRIVAEGSHRELIESSPIYQEIFSSQLGEGLKLSEAGITAG